MKSPRISLYDQSHTRAANRSGGPGLEQGQISSCGFLSDSDRKESACNAGDAGSIPRPGRSPADRDGNTSVSLPGEFHVQRSLAGYSPWGRKESEMTEWLTLSLSLQFSALATIRADHYCQPAVPDPEKRASWWPSDERRVPLTEDSRFRASDQPTQIPSTPRPAHTPLLRWMKVKVAQSCPTLCHPMGYPVHGILQARMLEWVAFPFSRGSSQPKDQTQVSLIAGGFFTSWATREGLSHENITIFLQSMSLWPIDSSSHLLASLTNVDISTQCFLASLSTVVLYLMVRAFSIWTCVYTFTSFSPHRELNAFMCTE